MNTSRPPGDFLTERVRSNLDVIDRMDYAPGATFAVDAAGATITKGSPLAEPGAMIMFLNLARPVVERAFTGCGVRLEIISQAADGTAECQVCGTAIRAAAARCTKCDTPHHPECWDCAGVCSTYGCGGRVARH